MSEVFIPRFRKLEDAMKEIKRADPQTVLTRFFIENLLYSKKITAMKYGDAWLINVDELYGFLQGEIFFVNKNASMQKRMRTSGEIYREFLEKDMDTIIRRPNLRKFAAENGVEHYITLLGKWIINFDDFMSKINPKNVHQRYEVPILRQHDFCVRQFQKLHPDTSVKMREVEEAIRSDNVYKAMNGKRWIINYRQMENSVQEITGKNIIPAVFY